MSKINGIYAASMSVLNDDLTLDIKKTIEHAEMLIEQGCHGAVIFGSTGQSQLISVSEKINLLNSLATNKYKEKYILGTGLNSLGETINLMRVANSLTFKNFLIMPPAYYKYGDKEVIKFYSKIIEAVSNCQIILYNFEKLSGYKFSASCVEELVNKYPQNIIGLKDSSYNLFETLKIKNFSIFPGSESKLLKGLELGCDGIITATTNITGTLAREVYDGFQNNSDVSSNKKLCDVRECFEKYNLISGLHTVMSEKNKIFENLLPPLKLLDTNKKKEILTNLASLEFEIANLKAA